MSGEEKIKYREINTRIQVKCDIPAFFNPFGMTKWKSYTFTSDYGTWDEHWRKIDERMSIDSCDIGTLRSYTQTFYLKD